MSNEHSETTTEQRVQAMIERAQFERLAQHVIRHGDSRYRSLIATGTNAQGETVVSPVDGFALVPGSSPPHYVLVESTTTDSDRLDKKWLFDHTTPRDPTKKPLKNPPRPADDGDLLKAARMAETIRAQIPTAVFTVVLATNQRVDIELATEVTKRAAALGVNADIWERSKIAHVLDVDATGQYLRWKYFGEAAERLSPELLREVAERTLERSSVRAAVMPDPSRWISRRVEDELHASLHAGATWLYLLAGESGFGKTVVAFRAMRRWLDEGGYALWLQEESFRGAASIEEVLDRTIRDVFSTVVETSSKVLASVLNGAPILLVVDDVNRTASPAVLLHQIARLAHALATTKALQVSILCPVWPHVVQGAELKKKDGVREIWIGRFSPEEASAALGNAPPEMAELLAFDPFIIGLYLSLIIDPPDGAIDARYIINEFIGRRLETIQSVSGTTCTYPEHKQATVQLAARSLETRTLEPSTAVLSVWFGTPALDPALREVLRYSALVFFTQEGGRIQYRHVRVRKHLLAMAMQSLALRDSIPEAFLDPFFAEIAGDTLVALNVPPRLIEAATQRAPLALASALQYTASNSDARELISRTLRSWVRSQISELTEVTFEYIGSGAHSVQVSGTFNQWATGGTDWALHRGAGGDRWTGTFRIPAGTHSYKFIVDGSHWIHDRLNSQEILDGYGGLNSIITVNRPRETNPVTLAVCQALARCDSIAVLDITRDIPLMIPYCFPLLLARLRNGDALAGVSYFATEFGDLAMTVSERDEVLRGLSDQRRAQLLGELLRYAPSLRGDRARVGAVRLAARLGGAASVAIAKACWSTADSCINLLAPCLTVMLTFDHAKGEIQFLDDLFRFFSELPSEGGTVRSEQARIADDLRMAGCRPSPAVMKGLVESVRDDPSLKNLVWTIFDGIDHPVPLEAISRWAGEQDEEERATGGMYLGVTMLGDVWRQSRRSIGRTSAAHLESLWQSSTESDGVRRCAFILWTFADAPNAMQVLQTVRDQSPIFESAIWHRARLGDFSAVSAVAERFRQSTRWAGVAHRIWSAPLVAVADAHLLAFATDLTAHGAAESNEHYDLATLLRRVPATDARELLVKHWNHLRREPGFLHTAIGVGGAELEQLVEKTVKEWPPAAPSPFRYFASHLLTETVGEPSTVDRGTFERLLRYVAFLDRPSIWRIAQDCRRRGYGRWATRTFRTVDLTRGSCLRVSG